MNKTAITAIKTGENSSKESENPFLGSRLQRSPIQSTLLEQRQLGANSESVVQSDYDRISALSSNSTKGNTTGGRTETPTSHFFNSKIASASALERKMRELGAKIDALQLYYKDRQNVHHAIKKMGSDIKHLHLEAMILIEKREKETTAVADKTVSKPSEQSATPQVTMASYAMRAANTRPNSGTITLSGKRHRENVSPTRRKQEDQGCTVSAKSPAAKKKRSTAQIAQISKPLEKTSKEAWTLVKNNKPQRKTNIRPKTDAIIITANKDGTSYANILKMVKTSEALKSLGEAVKAIRRTGTGELLLELKRNPEDSAATYQSAITEVLKETATVATRSHMVTLQCRDLDEITTKGEICDALHTQCAIKRPEESAIRSLRAAYSGTQTAFISLPAEDAKKVLSTQRVRIGWVSCRLREIVSPKRCFKCWGYGHMAIRCTDIDRSGLCRKCGKPGHMATSCVNKENCALCSGEHAAGNVKCPRFQEALKRKT